MTADSPVVPVHSVAEAYLYLMVTPCRICGKGPLRQDGDITKTDSAKAPWSLKTTCDSCNERDAYEFTIDPPPTREEAQSSIINPTTKRSSAIDILGWLTLFRSILNAAGKEQNKETGRQLAYEASQCLDEALRFYADGEELPGEDAFYSESALQRFRSHPQEFAKSKWRERRLKLPDMRVKTRSGDGPTSKRWWQFWR